MPRRHTKYDTGIHSGKAKVLPDPPSYVPAASWQSFPGFSFLFDNPANAVSVESGYMKIAVDVEQSPDLGLYASIGRATRLMNPAELAQKFQFFALPSSTYHLTVWDGVNKETLVHLDSDSKQEFELCFARGIDTILPNWPPLGNSRDYAKWFDGVRPVRFKYGGLRSRDKTVLVVQLEPADDTSAQELRTIEAKRAELDSYFAGIGKPENYPYRPHVAIGYFSDPDTGGKAVLQNMDKWMGHFNDEVSDATIEFHSIDLYAFTDMITYIKPL